MFDDITFFLFGLVGRWILLLLLICLLVKQMMRFSLVFLILGLLPFIGQAQMLSAPYMQKAKAASTLTPAIDTVFLPPPPFVPIKATIFLLTPSLPINFSRIEKDNGTWQVAGSVTAGLAYCLLIGQGTTMSNGSTEVIPYISIGPYVDAGGLQNLLNKGVLGSVSIGGTLALYKYVGILVAYDVVNKVPLFGLGASISIFSFTQGNGNILLNPKSF